MYVIVGLGNPGAKYERTRHNVGFEIINVLARRNKINVEKSKCKAIIGEGAIGGQRAVLCKPQTFMNLSGESVVQLLNWY
ncbi:MAG: aminoacyl-tRNA hydrolase, partial [Clostridia bacterium]|nr:aminoacyl-tRNA hydrolase [Clostridia bacterium]